MVNICTPVPPKSLVAFARRLRYSGGVRDKVYEHLSQRPEGATTQDLVDLIFVARGQDATVPARIVTTLLSDDERFILREPEGRWYTRLHDTLATSLDDTTFVVVDLETTSLGTSAHHIIEIAAARVRHGKVLAELSHLVNPGLRLPPFITRLTGIDDAMLADQPTIYEIWPRFIELLGQDVLVAHNASFDLSFLNAVSTLLNGAPLGNPVLCTLKLARRLLPDLKRRGLDALAAHYAIPQSDRHRALGDVRITTEVLFHLLERCPPLGVVRLDQALALQDQARDGRRFECFLPQEKIRQLPSEPGIYRLYGSDSRLLYVGRARNLRERVGSYLSNAAGHSNKTLELIRHAYDVRVEALGSELEAALEEAAAIRRERPPYNRLAKHLPRVAFIKLTVGDELPRLAMTTKPRHGRSRYFGPFRDRVEAEQIIGLLTRLYRLRTCPGQLKPAPEVVPCFQEQAGACTAPCAARVTAADYRSQVDSCLRLLDGDAREAESRLIAQRDALSEALRFEAAARTQRDIELLGTVVRKQRARSWIKSNPNLLILQPARGRVVLAYVVLAGSLAWRTRLHAAADVDHLGETITAVVKEPRLVSGDEQTDGMTIVAAWLRDHGERDGYVFELAPGMLETERPATQVEEWRAACASLLSASAP